MHFGATLRLLRLDSGLSLRDLARRLSVSGAYLSRVENGLDSVPTPLRLVAIARELDVPEQLMLGLAQQVSPLVVDYIRDEPEALSLFLDIAQRRLNAADLREIRQLVRARFPLVDEEPSASLPPWAELIGVDRIVVGMTCSSLDDVLDLAGGRLAGALGAGGWNIAAKLRTREREVSSAIGGGVAVPSISLDGAELRAAVVTLARPLDSDTPDRAPIHTVIALVGPRASRARRLCLMQVARWTARGLFSELAEATAPAEVHALLLAWEAGM